MNRIIPSSFSFSNIVKTFCAMSFMFMLSACSPEKTRSFPPPPATEQANPNQPVSGELQVPSPDWRKQIIYFLMIDRFNDGNSGNNDQGTGEYDPNKESHFHGGDIAGIRAQLPYIKNLGATAVWLTPPVKNLWWSEASNYGGYHGYWATHFKKIDEHFGTLADYQALSKQLHSQNMYLIQDIVLNHSAPLFGYPNGTYNPKDTQQHFELFPQASPLDLQAPFDLFNRNNPAHVNADIYHWTPPIIDQKNPEQLLTYQLADLADINTSNPQVVSTFKGTYNYWIREAGVDAFRVDTAKYVEHTFWQQFFHGKNGIQAQARALGKNEFLSFAEVFNFSEPYQNNGEQALQAFYGDYSSQIDKPEFNSVLGFPLFQEIERVFAQGSPTEQMAYRLQQHMQYRDPYRVVNFVDNHDVKRFLSAGSVASFKQALALIFTIPGIPAIYQGSEQGFTESRQSLFAPHNGQANAFDQQSSLYRFIQKLAKLRLSDDAFTLGDLQVLQADKTGAGALVYTRSYTDPQTQKPRHKLIVMNTASHRVLLANLNVRRNQAIAQQIRREGYPHLVPLLTEAANRTNDENNNETSSKPLLLADNQPLELPANSINVFELDWHSDAQSPVTISDVSDIVIETDDNLDGEVFTQDIHLTGAITYGKTPIFAVVNGNLDTAHAVIVDETGQFDLTLPVRNLGAQKVNLQLYAPELGVVSKAQQFTMRVDTPAWQAQKTDANNDAFGLTKHYHSPTHEMSGNQREILAASAQAAGANLTLTLTMQEISNTWGPANGFDNVSFSVYFHLPEYEKYTLAKAKPLPHINASFPQGEEWSVGHVLFGWGNAAFHPNAVHPEEKGEQFGAAPQVTTDIANNTITIRYSGEAMGIRDWSNAQIYISTWDMSGEGYFRELAEKADNWAFGCNCNDATTMPKIMDDITLQLTPFTRPAQHNNHSPEVLP